MLTINSLVKEVEGLGASIRVKRVDSGLRVCTAIGFLDHSLNQDCATMTI